MIIAIDFDGTCVSHAFPKVGKDIGAVPVLKELVANGHQLILFTMRSNVVNISSPEFEGKFTGNYLDDAINWFIENNIPLWAIQTNPTQRSWTSSPKAYAHLYIDDCGLGIPLIELEGEDRPCVNWYEARKLLKEKGLL